jgi:HEAT repeat protein
VLVALSRDAELDVRRAAITAMGLVGSPTLLPVVVDSLLDEATRKDAENVLSTNGQGAFDALRRRFEDGSTDPELRWRIPPALSLSNQEQAITALVSWLPRELDGKVRFQIIRTLERLVRRHPSFPLDRAPLERAVTETVERAYLYLDCRLILTRAAAKAPERKTPGHELLCTLLRDKSSNARGKLFRLLGLLHPTEDFGQIYRGLGGGRELRATSMELIESILGEPVRSAVLGLADDGDDALRLSRAGRYHRPLSADYEAVLDLLAAGKSDSVRDVAHFHAAELGLSKPGRQGRAA